jgi:hypothetical protein
LSFLSREQRLQAKVENVLLLVWAAIFAVLLFGIGPLSGLPGTAVTALSAGLAPIIFIAVRRKFDARLRAWLDGGY